MSGLATRKKQDLGRWANNRFESSHPPFRRRERAMQRFRRIKTLQKFASVHVNISNHFSTERHALIAIPYKLRRAAALAEWQRLAA